MAAIEKKKEEPKLLINKLDVLFKSNQETSSLLAQAVQQVSGYAKVDDVRKEQVALYTDTVKNVLGIDPVVMKDRDPFYRAAGVDIEDVTLKKHELLGEEYKTTGVVSATTLLLSKEYFQELKKFKTERFQGGKIYGYKGIAVLDQELKYASLNLFDPIMVNQKRNWDLLFGFTTLQNNDELKSNGIVFRQGTLMLHDEPLKAIQQSQECKNISHKLEEMATWFNHDLVSHSSFLPGHSAEVLDNTILQLGKKYDLIDAFDDIKGAGEQGFGSAFAGELWSLNFHESVFQEFVAQRPAIMRYMRAHLDSYARSIEKAVSTLSDKEFARDTREYMLKAYAFCFFRLIDPKKFATDPIFKDLQSKYPHLADLGLSEEQTRNFTFGEKGLVTDNAGEKRFIPHKKVFKEFTDSFESAKAFGGMKDRIHEALVNKDVKLTQQEKEQYREFIKKLDNKSAAIFILNLIEDWDIFDSWLVGANLDTAIDCLLDEKTTQKRFTHLLAQRIEAKRRTS